MRSEGDDGRSSGYNVIFLSTVTLINETTGLIIISLTVFIYFNLARHCVNIIHTISPIFMNNLNTWSAMGKNVDLCQRFSFTQIESPKDPPVPTTEGTPAVLLPGSFDLENLFAGQRCYHAERRACYEADGDIFL